MVPGLMPLRPVLPPPHPLTGKEVSHWGLQAGAGPPNLLHLLLLLPHTLILIIQPPEEEAIKAHLEVGRDEDRDQRAEEGRKSRCPALSPPTASPLAWEGWVRAQLEKAHLEPGRALAHSEAWERVC